MPAHLKAIKAFSQVEISRLIAKYGRLTPDQILAQIQDPKTPVIEVTIAAIFARAAKSGDSNALAFLLDRAIGKQAPVVETPEVIEARERLQSMTDKEILRLMEQKVIEARAKESTDGGRDAARDDSASTQTKVIPQQ